MEQTADFVNLLGPLMLLRCKFHQDPVYDVHVPLHGCHATRGITIVVTGHRHPEMLVDMIVQHCVVGGRELAEWAKARQHLVDPVHTSLMAMLQCLLSVEAPKAHQACTAKTVGIVIGNILAIWVGYYHHDVFNADHLFLREMLGAGLGHRLQQALVIQGGRDVATHKVLVPCCLGEHHVLHDARLRHNNLKIFGMILEVEHCLLSCRQVVLMVCDHLGQIHVVSVLTCGIQVSSRPLVGGRSRFGGALGLPSLIDIL